MNRFALLTALLLVIFATACGTGAPAGAAPASADSPVVAEPPPPPPPHTEALPPDGGDVGKAYQDLVAAYRAVDANLAAKRLFVGNDYELEKRQTDSYLLDMERVHPSGGLRQGDRATLFLEGADNWVGTFDATRVADGWRFDTANPSSGRVDRNWANYPDCRGRKRFPCKVRTFPDSTVAGHVDYHFDPSVEYLSPAGVLLDGFGVRMLDGDSRELKYTRVVLSGSGFGPRDIERMDGDSLNYLSRPSVVLDLAPDNKSAKLTFLGPYSKPDLVIEVTEGLSVDASTRNRIRGHLHFDAKDAAKFDADFDVEILSECLIDINHCGNDLSDAVLR